MPTFLMMCLLSLGCVDDIPIYAAYVPHNQMLLKPTDNGPSPPKPEADPDAKNLVDDENSKSLTKQVVEKASDSRLDINSASIAELDGLPGIGPAIAARIDAYRKKRKFRRVRDIRRVRGIGTAKFAELKDLITVEADP